MSCPQTISIGYLVLEFVGSIQKYVVQLSPGRPYIGFIFQNILVQGQPKETQKIKIYFLMLSWSVCLVGSPSKTFHCLACDAVIYWIADIWLICNKTKDHLKTTSSLSSSGAGGLKWGDFSRVSSRVASKSDTHHWLQPLNFTAYMCWSETYMDGFYGKYTDFCVGRIFLYTAQ